MDKTTEGITAEPEEVEAVLHNLCGYHLAEPDPLQRYNVLTREQVLYDALVAVIKRERARALADLVASGQTLTQIAAMTNLGTRQRVQRMVAMARAAEEAAAVLQQASRDFDERLAAVEATLDEVVSGFVVADPAPVSPEVGYVDPADAGLDLLEIAAVDATHVRAARLAEGYDPTAYHNHAYGYDAAYAAAGYGTGYDAETGYGDGGSAELTEAGSAGPDGDGSDDPDAVLEPTQYLPALRPLLHPTKEMPPSEENPRWWRRNRDTGAA